MRIPLRKTICIALSIFLILIGSFYLYLLWNHTTPILMYHSFDASRIGEYAAVSPGSFYQQLSFIKNHGYHVISLTQYCKALQEGKEVSPRDIIITIDDGYKDNLAAIQMLKNFNYPATLFLSVNTIGKPGFLSQTDIERILETTSVEIGSHTLSHPLLPEVDDGQLQKEIVTSKKILEDLFSQPVQTFSYPVGAFDKHTLSAVKEAGYLCACTTNRGFSSKLNRFALRRLKVTDRDEGIRMWSKVNGFYNTLKKPKNPY